MYDIWVLVKKNDLTKHSIDICIKFKHTMVKVIPRLDFNAGITNAEVEDHRKNKKNIVPVNLYSHHS